jgi:hypothetical protein
MSFNSEISGKAVEIDFEARCLEIKEAMRKVLEDIKAITNQELNCKESLVDEDR